MNPLAVSTLAEGMMQDAWNYFSGTKDSAAAEKVAVFNNTDIRRLSEVGLWLYSIMYNSTRTTVEWEFLSVLCNIVHSDICPLEYIDPPHM